MARASLGDNGTAPGRRVAFWCPGCDGAHSVTVDTPDGWGWNGSLELPTFTPSVKVGGTQWEPGDGFYKPTHDVKAGQPIVCHSFVTDGRIQFLNDCTHQMGGQTVDLPEFMPGD